MSDEAFFLGTVEMPKRDESKPLTVIDWYEGGPVVLTAGGFTWMVSEALLDKMCKANGDTIQKFYDRHHQTTDKQPAD